MFIEFFDGIQLLLKKKLSWESKSLAEISHTMVMEIDYISI